MRKATLGFLFIGSLLLPGLTYAGPFLFSSGPGSPMLRVTFDPQPEPPGIAGGSSALVQPAAPVDAFWFALLRGDSPLGLIGYSPLLDAAGGQLFGVTAAYGEGGLPSYFLDVLFDPQPEPPGKWALVMFDPQPEPPGRSIVAVGPSGAPDGFDLFLSGFDPQPEPPGLGDRGAYWFYEGSIVQGQFGAATFTLRTVGGTLPLTPVPEPASTITLLGGGLFALMRLRRKLTR